MVDPAEEGLPLTDEQLLLSALRGEPGAWRQLVRRMEPFLSAIARRRLPDLPPDIQREFHQEVWSRVANRAPEDFDPATDSARSFVGRFVSAAINAVRAAYRPPGQRSRDRTRRSEVVPLPDIGLLADERAAREFEAVAARIDLQRLVALADPITRKGLQLMIDEGIGLAAAARRVGLSRETYRRRVVSLPALLDRS